jgi:O-antigen biosynthesis protein
VILATYALLPEHLRFSRGILTFGALLAFGVLSLSRWVLIKAGLLQQHLEQRDQPYLLVASSAAEFSSVKILLQSKQLDDKVIGRVAIHKEDTAALTHISHVASVGLPLHTSELIFCTGTYTYKDILTLLPTIKGNLRFRFHAAGSSSIVGSDSGSTSGEVLAHDSHFKLDQPTERRLKRLIDVLSSVFFLLTFPIHFLFVQKPFAFLSHCMQVLWRQRTWVGYGTKATGLPRLPKSILLPTGEVVSKVYTIPEESMTLIDHYYASDYDPFQDLWLIIKNYTHLGNK